MVEDRQGGATAYISKIPPHILLLSVIFVPFQLCDTFWCVDLFDKCLVAVSIEPISDTSYMQVVCVIESGEYQVTWHVLLVCVLYMYP